MQQMREIEYIIDNTSLCAWIEDSRFVDPELTIEQIEDLLREENDEALLDFCISEEDEEERANSLILWRFVGEPEYRNI